MGGPYRGGSRKNLGQMFKLWKKSYIFRPPPLYMTPETPLGVVSWGGSDRLPGFTRVPYIFWLQNKRWEDPSLQMGKGAKKFLSPKDLGLEDSSQNPYCASPLLRWLGYTCLFSQWNSSEDAFLPDFFPVSKFVVRGKFKKYYVCVVLGGIFSWKSNCRH